MRSRSVCSLAAGVALTAASLVLAVSGPTRAFTRGGSSTEEAALVGPMPTETTVEVGAITTVQLRVQNIADLFGADVRMQFDPTFVEVVDADSATPGVQVALLSTFLSPDWVLRNVAENQDGSIWYAVTQVQPSLPVTGSGALADISFRGLVAGTSPIEVTYRKLVRRDGTMIETAIENSRIVVVVGGSTATPGASPTPRPTTERTATTTPTDEPADITPTPAATMSASRTPPPTRQPILLPKLFKPRRQAALPAGATAFRAGQPVNS